MTDIVSAIQSARALRRRLERMGIEDQAVLEGAIADAIVFLEALPASAAAPLVSAADDGEVVLTWICGHAGNAVASFDGTGRYGYAIRPEGGAYRPGAEDARLGEAVPSDLLKVISSASGLNPPASA